MTQSVNGPGHRPTPRELGKSWAKMPWSVWACPACRQTAILIGEPGDALACPYCASRVVWLGSIAPSSRYYVLQAIVGAVFDAALSPGSQQEEQ